MFNGNVNQKKINNLDIHHQKLLLEKHMIHKKLIYGLLV